VPRPPRERALLWEMCQPIAHLNGGAVWNEDEGVPHYEGLCGSGVAIPYGLFLPLGYCSNVFDVDVALYRVVIEWSGRWIRD